MPEHAQKEKDFGRHTFSVNVVKGFSSDNAEAKKGLEFFAKEEANALKRAEAAKAKGDMKAYAAANKYAKEAAAEKADMDYIPVNSDYKQWTKQDLLTIASNRHGVVMFQHLGDIAVAAARTNATKTDFSDDAKLAQKALAEVAPNGMTWQQYFKVIKEVAIETQLVRQQLMEKYYPQKPKTQNAKVGALFELPQGITVDPTENKGFDQQTALAILGERGVKVDVDQSHKTPNFEQEALKAVASLKNTVITRAA